MAQEMVLERRELTKVWGLCLMPSYGRCEVTCEVLAVLEDRA